MGQLETSEYTGLREAYRAEDEAIAEWLRCKERAAELIARSARGEPGAETARALGMVEAARVKAERARERVLDVSKRDLTTFRRSA